MFCLILEDPLRRVKYREGELKRPQSESITAIGTNKSQKVDYVYDISWQHLN